METKENLALFLVKKAGSEPISGGVSYVGDLKLPSPDLTQPAPPEIPADELEKQIKRYGDLIFSPVNYTTCEDVQYRTRLSIVPVEFREALVPCFLEEPHRSIVFKYISVFSQSAPKALASALLAGEPQGIDVLAANLHSFREAAPQRMLFHLLEKVTPYKFDYLLQHFDQLDHDQIAVELIARSWGHVIFYFAEYFKLHKFDLIMTKIFEAPTTEALEGLIDSLKMLGGAEKLNFNCQLELTMDEALSAEGRAKRQHGSNMGVAENKDVSSGLSLPIGSLDAGVSSTLHVDDLGAHSSAVPFVSPPDASAHRILALHLLDIGATDLLSRNLFKFTGLGDADFCDLAERLFNMREGRVLARRVYLFSGIDKQAVLERLMSEGYLEAVNHNMTLFNDLDLRDVAKRLLREGHIVDPCNCRGLDEEAAVAYAELGFAAMPFRYSKHFVALRPEVVHRIAAITGKDFIRRGLFEKAEETMTECNAPFDCLYELVAADIHRMTIKEKSLERVEVRNLATFAAWSHVHPDLVEFLETKGLAGALNTYRDLFVNHEHLPHLVRRGIPLLQKLGWFEPEYFKVLSEMLKVFFRQGANSETAWASYWANLSAGDAPFLRRGDIDIRKEMTMLLEFRQDYPNLHAPQLYRMFRALGDPVEGALMKKHNLPTNRKELRQYLRQEFVRLQEHLLGNEGKLSISMISSLREELICTWVGLYSANELRCRYKDFYLAIKDGAIAPIDPCFMDLPIKIHRDEKKIGVIAQDVKDKYEQLCALLHFVQPESLSGVVESLKHEVIYIAGIKMEKAEANIRMERSPEMQRKCIVELEEKVAAITRADSPEKLMQLFCDYREIKAVRLLAMRLIIDAVGKAGESLEMLSAGPDERSVAILSDVMRRPLEGAWFQILL